MRLYHYTSKPPETIEARSQEKSDGRKPVGFWLSDCDAGDGWSHWCEAEDYRNVREQTRLAVDVDTTKILHLKSVFDIDDFSTAYPRTEAFGRWEHYLIDWARVAQEYAGILVSPYQWGRRLDGAASDWYYSWDCASGCIWNPSAILGWEIDNEWAAKSAA